jgi:hypothetical protein
MIARRRIFVALAAVLLALGSAVAAPAAVSSHGGVTLADPERCC